MLPGKRRLIWADDDNRLALKLLRGILEEQGLRIEDFSDAAATKSFITELSKGGPLSEISLLVDVMLPMDHTGKAPSPYVGMDLAEFACAAEIGAVGFLTVVDVQEVTDRLNRLRQSYPAVPIQYFDKLLLLEDDTLDEMGEFLRNPRPPSG